MALQNLLSYATSALLFLNSTPPSPAPIEAPVRHFSSAPTCPVNSSLSCHTASSTPPSCCYIAPGGQLLLTQFWDAHPAVGPAFAWTLHGLWPDNCDGSYPAFCNAAPRRDNITGVLLEQEGMSLLQEMRRIWLPNRGSAEHFWQHEWNKHGTCVNTLAPRCYASEDGDESEAETDVVHTSTTPEDQGASKTNDVTMKAATVRTAYQSGQEVVDYLQRAVSLYNSLDTYAALEQTGIIPHLRRYYRRTAIETALRNITGANPVIRCRAGDLNEVWYAFNVRGNLQTGEFVPSEPVGKALRSGQCGRWVRYPPKGTKY